ncbi:MAG: LPS export ABC transporter periplasmic protein LptC [Syntrophobacteraceae bacterium]
MAISRKIAQGLIILVVTVLGLVLAAGVWKGKGPGMEAPDPTVSESEMKLTDIEFTEMEQGKRFWTLRASEATYSQTDQLTFLKTVHMTFYMEDNEEIHLQSQEGTYNTGTKDVQLSRAVRAELPRGYVVTTERVDYDHKLRTISSNDGIQLSGPGATFEGKHWNYRIKERIGSATGGVTVSLVGPEVKLEKTP